MPSIETAIHSACLLEVTARKPGNVHPLAVFDDCDWKMFAASAEAIAPVLADAESRPIGEMILQAVQATNDCVGRNTNLGMILLLAPLAAAIPDDLVPLSPGREGRGEGASCGTVRPLTASEDWRANLSRILDATTIDDCRLVYEAIRLAWPGGLGSTDQEDVTSPPSVTLTQAMRLASDRDDVAKQYASDFADVFTLAGRFNAANLPALERQIVATHVRRIAAASDTLIARKCGPAIAAEASRIASEVVVTGLFDSEGGRTKLTAFDDWLRADGNRRNPGTTADLIAAALFVAIQEGRIPCFEPAAIIEFARRMRAAGVHE